MGSREVCGDGGGVSRSENSSYQFVVRSSDVLPGQRRNRNLFRQDGGNRYTVDVSHGRILALHVLGDLESPTAEKP